MQTSLAEFEKIIDAPSEDRALEFKKAETQFDLTKLFRRCVAIGNEGGGKIILGVTDKRPRKVIDTKAFPNIGKIEADIFAKLQIRVVVEELKHPDGRVVIFHVPTRAIGSAFSFEGQYLMRVGEETQPMSPDRLRAIFSEGKPNWASRIAMENCTSDTVVQNLDTQKYFDLLKQPVPTTRDAVLERFQSESLIVKNGDSWSITNLGAIAFAKDLRAFESLSRRGARVIVYRGKGKLDTRLDQTGYKGIAVGFEGLVDFVFSHVPANEVVTKALREERQMFPRIAIRELIANALIHQDFEETGTSVRIELYDDRVEISNPGKPMIPVDRFIDEYQSRNESLSDLMRRLRICEAKSSGIDQVVHAAEVYQLPAPDIRVGEVHTSVVLFAHKDFEDMDRSERIRACYQHCCLRWVMNEKMTNQSLRDRFGLPDNKNESISRILRETMETGRIKLADVSVTSTRYRSYIPSWA